jgi:molybdate transport system ATP-binding protein
VNAGLDASIDVTVGTFNLNTHLNAAPGELVVLVGPNGAGKSTVVQALTGLRPLDRGRIVLDGAVLDEPALGTYLAPHNRSIGVQFQDRLLFEHMSVLDNVAFGLRSRGATRRDARRIATEWLQRFGLSHHAGARPQTLSGGQAQRVALARALAPKPSLLLLDEPLAALDATTHVEIRRELRTHVAGLDIPVIMITHDPVEAMTLGDRIVVIEHGRITQQGTPTDVRSRPRSRYVADLVGVNLLRGRAEGTIITLANSHVIAIPALDGNPGPVIATVHPRAVTLHASAPDGSARNVWATTVFDIDDEGDRIRVHLGDPVPLTAEITPAALAALSLQPDAPVWLSFKATEVHVHRD